MPSCLAVDASRPAAGILAHTFPRVSQQPPMADQTIQLAEPFPWLGCCEASQMFKFTEWVAHEV
jgi:hypothetical protein